MNKIFERTINLLGELIDIRNKQIILYTKMNEITYITPFTFKIKNDNKWIRTTINLTII